MDFNMKLTTQGLECSNVSRRKLEYAHFAAVSEFFTMKILFCVRVAGRCRLYLVQTVFSLESIVDRRGS